MTTIINTPPTNTHTVEKVEDSSGWAVALIILLALIAFGGYFWFRYYREPAPNPTTNINVTLPPVPEKVTPVSQ